MPTIILIVLTLTVLTFATTLTARAFSTRPRYHPDGYRMIRRQWKPTNVLAGGVGFGAVGGLLIVLVGLSVLG